MGLDILAGFIVAVLIVVVVSYFVIPIDTCAKLSGVIDKLEALRMVWDEYDKLIEEYDRIESYKPKIEHTKLVDIQYQNINFLYSTK